jgi:pyruvate,water dikinase
LLLSIPPQFGKKFSRPEEVLGKETETIPLHKITDADGPAVGGKAASLAHLKKIGLRVPAGFCITATAYRKHRESLGSSLGSILEALSAAGAEDKGKLLSKVRQEITDSPVSDSLHSAIQSNCERLGGKRFAVRSSATAEDLPGHSFAGQYDTFLDVPGTEACLDAVKKCWASLWTDRAYKYRERNGFDHLAVDMAVIVQELVPADAAGVAFTANPVTGQSDKLIVEACRGLGESLVSGQVTPDRFVLNATDLAIVDRSVASGSPCIDEDVAQQLGKLAKQAEEAFGSPQDVEWAIKEGEIFFLQSRPITTLRAKSADDRQVWTNLNAGEVLPDVVTPVTWSMIPITIETMFEPIIGGMGLVVGDASVFGLVAGRAYFNLNVLAGILKRIPGAKGKDLTRIMGGEQDRAAELGHIEISEDSIPDLNFSLLRLALRMPGLLVRAARFSGKKGQQLVFDSGRKADELQSVDIDPMSEDELAAFFQRALDELLSVVGAVAFAGIGMLFFAPLDKISRKWLGDTDGTYANRLLAGMGGMQSAEAGLAFWRLAAKARENSSLENALLENDAWKSIRDKITKISGGDEFLENWDEFMATHGHHTRGEVELYNARWAEKPNYVLDIVRGYLGQSDESDPAQNYAERTREREELEDECRRKLRNPIKRTIFNFCLHQARRGSLIRENMKNTAVRNLAVMRNALLELDDKLRERGILENTDDIFFLGMDELEPARKGEAEFDVTEVVASRRAEYERNLTITPPQVVVGKFDPDRRGCGKSRRGCRARSRHTESKHGREGAAGGDIGGPLHRSGMDALLHTRRRHRDGHGRNPEPRQHSRS